MLTDERILQAIRDSGGDWNKVAAVIQREGKLDELAQSVQAKAQKAINEVIEPARADPTKPIPSLEQIDAVMTVAEASIEPVVSVTPEAI